MEQHDLPEGQHLTSEQRILKEKNNINGVKLFKTNNVEIVLGCQKNDILYAPVSFIVMRPYFESCATLL